MISLSILDQNLNDISYTDFLAAFGYGSKDIIYLRQFYDPERGDARKREVSFSSFDAILSALRDLESRKYGTFFVVNGGGHGDADVKVARAQFIDMDDFSIEEQLLRISMFPLEPSVIIMTSRSLHCYWLLVKGDIRRFRSIQKRLVQNFKSDAAIINESRVMRLYGFLHQKQDPVMVRLIKFDPQLRYTQDQLEEVLPELSADQDESEFIPAQVSDSSAFFGKCDGERFLLRFMGKHNIGYSKKKVWNGWTMYFVRCPWEAEHSSKGGGSATALIVGPTGILGFKCMHAHCSHRRWKDYRNYIETHAGGDRP